MTPDAPPWLQRWQQAEDDELLYVDQTILLYRGVPLEEYVGLPTPPEEDLDDEP